ncbi:ankyrin repeat-containing protein ITN1-like [Rosa rugosa]|uniref:ankyrin repeat-containing protein ITN1-like n=1 Tax=Rosa rugosa TaxID=74645 RepID=UPI002B40220D|nr:ankyrin repeat-containing protein ITN1-like [Rosa rugosa]
MGEATKNYNLKVAEFDIVTKSIFKAVETGHVEFITQICKANPKLAKTLDEKTRSIYHFAIECRQEKIYSLIYGIKKEARKRTGRSVDNFNNNMLHAAGILSPLSQFDHLQGATLQMQRELQWFKEVESIVPFDKYECLNQTDKLTARELFTKNHKKLMDEAEISIKHMATSCTVVGALIATMMFAAAFTIPGGNNGNTGIPMFIDERLFLAFIVSDALSLVSSTTSVIIFLGLLTSRYAEDDFLKSLPKKIMIGLFTLFISIATMVTAFSSALVIMLHGNYSWIVIPSIILVSVPITSFVWVQFPLLLGTLISTYGPGIFDKDVQPWF